jgi:hypothetical protein
MDVGKTIKEELRKGPRRAKDIVDASMSKGATRANVFYWLSKLGKVGEIRKIGERYELVKIEEASAEEIDFLLKKIVSGSGATRKAATHDFEALCGEKIVAHQKSVWDFIKRGIGGFYDDEAKYVAIETLHLIATNPLTAKDQYAQKNLLSLRGRLEEAVLNESLDIYYREKAAIVLYRILPDKERFTVSLEMLKKLMMETAGKKGLQLFKWVGMEIWDMVLDEYFDERKMELRKWVYNFLEDRNATVRDMAFRLLNSFRLKERGFR